MEVIRYLAQAAGERAVTYEIRTLAAPGAGNEFTFTVPTGEIWLLHAIHAQFVASAAVANRTPTLIVDDQTTTSARFSDGAVITAGSTVEITWSPVGAFSSPANSAVIMANLYDDLILQSGWRVRSLTQNLDAGDAYSALAATATVVNRPMLTLAERIARAEEPEAALELALRERGV